VLLQNVQSVCYNKLRQVLGDCIPHCCMCPLFQVLYSARTVALMNTSTSLHQNDGWSYDGNQARSTIKQWRLGS
jgi:hypothetical protein